MIYDLIIVGGGPAAVAAGVYAARKRIKSLIIARDWGGQSKASTEVQNFIGIKAISGSELAERLEEHVKAYAENVLDFDEGSLVTKILKVDNFDNDNPIFVVETDKGKRYEARTLMITAGASRKRLNVPGAEEFDGRGVVYCASCDAPLFRDRTVAVIGGGNAGLESAQQLLEYCPKVYILEYMDEIKGDELTKNKILESGRVEIITSAEVTEIKGGKFVEKLFYKDRKTNEVKDIAVQGIFVEIGSIPNSDFTKGLIEHNKYGEIVVDHKNGQTLQNGIWAAGDVTDQPYKQNNISMGDAIKALEDLYLWLQRQKTKNS